MSAEIIQFIPRSNPKADKAFSIGAVDPLETMAMEIVNQIFQSDEPLPYFISPPPKDRA